MAGHCCSAVLFAQGLQKDFVAPLRNILPWVCLGPMKTTEEQRAQHRVHSWGIRAQLTPEGKLYYDRWMADYKNRLRQLERVANGKWGTCEQWGDER